MSGRGHWESAKHKQRRLDEAERKLALFRNNLFAHPEWSFAECAMPVWNCKDKASARALGHWAKKKLGISIVEIMERAGMSEEDDVNKLKNLTEGTTLIEIGSATHKKSGKRIHRKYFKSVPDNSTRLQAIDRSLKIKGVIKNANPNSDDPNDPDGQRDRNTYITLIGSIKESDARTIGSVVSALRDRVSGERSIQSH